MNERGQEGAGFRLLIEAVLVVFILVIVLGVVSQIDAWKWQISERRLYEGFAKALNSPDGSVIVEKELVLKGGASYSSRTFAQRFTGIESECIEINASASSAFSLSNNMLVEITTLIQTDVYYKCQPGSQIGESQCQPYCTVGFGKDLRKED